MAKNQAKGKTTKDQLTKEELEALAQIRVTKAMNAIQDILNEHNCTLKAIMELEEGNIRARIQVVSLDNQVDAIPEGTDGQEAPPANK